MAWIVVIIIIVVFVAIKSKPTKKPPVKYISYPENIVESDNERRERIARGEHDEMYLAYQDHHQGKSLAQIEQYIKAKREEGGDYWSNSRLEYKVLMDLARPLEISRNAEIKQLIESDQIYQYSYSKLLEYYRMITYNPHIYAGFNLNLLNDALEKASFQKFHPELITKTPSTVLIWLNTRKKKGEYIASKLNDIATEMAEQESPEEAYKRQRKNIQSNISKAKKENNWLKTEEFEQKLINLEKTKGS